MAYRNNRRAARRSNSAASRWMTVRYNGACKVCAQTVTAGARAFWDAQARTLTCDQNNLDCARADGLTEWRHPTGPWDQWESHEVLADHRIGTAAPVPAGPVRVTTCTFNSGASVSVNVNGRCEEAPCCGCCS